MKSLPDFDAFFRALWTYAPFPWQRMLAERIAEGHWPQVLDLPTAAGKTACIDAAVYALACQAKQAVADRTAPRRIWFVVDRRIVVDEAFDRASTIARKLSEAEAGPLKQVAERLREISGTERPLSVARLRGGILRDDSWARLPSQPAVITSTVDQLGSRLLFRGYGRSHLTASIFAGLATHDSLILLDEAHCSVPFLQTLRNIQMYRGPAWAEAPITTPFAFAVLSATPPPDISHDAVFPGGDRQRALDDSVLGSRLNAPKPAELVTVKIRGAQVDPLVIEAATRARSYMKEDRKRRVGVIVNRVRTAVEIAHVLRENSDEDVDVVLLTGRLRPFERDSLVDKWKPFLRAASPQQPPKPVVLVSTQCIEVGADFSFDAMISEAASLDALRQRFGRLNRMGLPGAAPATILIRDRDTETAEPDPIYGLAIPKTWRLLSDKATSANEGEGKTRSIDFGFESLDKSLSDVEDLSDYLAPKSDAPILLPSHLDLLCQTAPVPSPEPDIDLFLHGKDGGTPEVRVVWRADLPIGDTDACKEIVALCPPNSGEMLSVPLHRLRSWLADQDTLDTTADVEGTTSAENEPSGNVRPVFLWRGRDRDRSRICSKASDIYPNDVVVLPAEYGIVGLGQSDTEAMATLDLWEPARFASGMPAGFRIQRAVLQPWLSYTPLMDLLIVAEDPDHERDELEEAIDTVLNSRPHSADDLSAPPHWLLELLHRARRGRVEDHPAGGVVLFERDSANARTAEPDLFADDNDLTSACGQAVSLERHSVSVERAVEKIASRCLPNKFLEPLRFAAYWHDVGKVDERFQLLLHQGDKIAAASSPAPLAKSAYIPESPARRRAIREASGLPQDFRHEMVSFQLTGQYAVLPAAQEAADLALHLVASHHGHARPFAPVCPDSEPPSISGSHGGVVFKLTAAERVQLPTPHNLASNLSDRFWKLTRRYGWWGLAYLEAVLRLGDWYGSQQVVDENEVEQSTQLGPGARIGTVSKQSVENSFELTGLDGANPLGFLAAVGTLVVLGRDAHLKWERLGTWVPILTGVPAENAEAVSQSVAEALRGLSVSGEAEEKRRETQEDFDAAKKEVNDKLAEIKKRRLRGREHKVAIEAEVQPLREEVHKKRSVWLKALKGAATRRELAIGKQIDCTADEYRAYATGFFEEGGDLAAREPLDLLAAFGCDACMEKSGRITATPFCFITGSGHQYFLDTVRQLMEKVSPERVHATLFEPWTYTDEKLSMRWDPLEDRRYALMDRDPTASDNKSRTMWMANLLAYRGLVLFPSVPRRGNLATTAWDLVGEDYTFTWPIWERPADSDTIRSLMLLPELIAPEVSHTILQARGIVAAFRSRRVQVGNPPLQKINFSPARGV